MGRVVQLWKRTCLRRCLLSSKKRGILGSCLFGPVAYIVGIAILWPLRQWERPVAAPRDLGPASNVCRAATVLNAALSLTSALLAALAFCILAYSLIVAGVTSLTAAI